MQLNEDTVIDPDKSYRIKLSRVVKVGFEGRIVLAPRNDNVVKGNVLETIRDSVTDIEALD